MDCECNLNGDAVCFTCGQHRRDANYIHLGVATHKDKNKEISILNELAGFKFSDDIKLKISILYNKAVGGKTKRNTPTNR